MTMLIIMMITKRRRLWFLVLLIYYITIATNIANIITFVFGSDEDNELVETSDNVE